MDGARRSFAQLLRFAIVGVVSNGLLWCLFVVLTRSGLRPQLAMTLMYALGVAQTFVLHRRWTFRHAGRAGAPLRRYLLLHAACYSFNLALLYALVDHLHLPAGAVQAVAIVLVALLLFAGQKFWVFARP